MLKSADVEHSVGPLLAKEIDYVQTLDGGEAFVNGEMIFRVNGLGFRLLKYADGKHTIEQIAQKINRPEIAGEIADFYISLSQAGYLQNRVEVYKYSNEYSSEYRRV